MGHRGSLECHILCAKGGKPAKDARSPSLQHGRGRKRGRWRPRITSHHQQACQHRIPSQVFLSSSWAVSGCLPSLDSVHLHSLFSCLSLKIKSQVTFFFFFLRLLLWQFLVILNNARDEGLSHLAFTHQPPWWSWFRLQCMISMYHAAPVQQDRIASCLHFLLSSHRYRKEYSAETCLKFSEWKERGSLKGTEKRKMWAFLGEKARCRLRMALKSNRFGFRILALLTDTLSNRQTITTSLFPRL